ncbi:MAG: HyfB, partial [uncultured bacterium]
MNNLFLALLIFILSGLVSLVFYRMNRCSSVIGIAGVLAGCVFGLLSALDVLVNENNLTLVLNWMPYLGDFSIGIDPLSAFFLVPVFIITPFIALYGGEYISQWSGKKNIGNTWFFFNILVASVVLVIISRNFILFLIAWEIMTVSSFILVLFEYEKSEVRYGGFLYLIIAHIGVVSLIV